MAGQPPVDESKVIKDALPIPSSKPEGNPAFRMLGMFILSTWNYDRQKEAGTGD